jgi:hypothetical protein
LVLGFAYSEALRMKLFRRPAKEPAKDLTEAQQQLAENGKRIKRLRDQAVVFTIRADKGEKRSS